MIYRQLAGECCGAFRRKRQIFFSGTNREQNIAKVSVNIELRGLSVARNLNEC